MSGSKNLSEISLFINVILYLLKVNFGSQYKIKFNLGPGESGVSKGCFSIAVYFFDNYYFFFFFHFKNLFLEF